ncbi:uncharacterized protein LOC117113849 [Anneissia japonica]|uniref:uncharacterized protein LOC117113849 n=1 Tax=Anneissia japonica TaxID=1529436 RepID=UPI0014256F1E|nr:uncharacterized protein LOC117113849 [Anneissia japonica]
MYSIMFVFLFSSRILKGVSSVCPEVHGHAVVSRSLVDSGSITGVNVGNPIACDGYIKGWRFFPTTSAQLIVFVFREAIAGKYDVVSRTVVPAQDYLNEVREYHINKADWIPVFQGVFIGFHHSGNLIGYDEDVGVDTSEYLLDGSVLPDNLISGYTFQISSGTEWRTYSFQAILADLETPNFQLIRYLMNPNYSNSGTVTDRIRMNFCDAFRNSGIINGWRFVASRAGDLIVFVFRASDVKTNTYEVVGKTLIQVTSAEIDLEVQRPLKYSEQIAFLPGDRIGLANIDSVLKFKNIVFSMNFQTLKSDTRQDIRSIDVGSLVAFTSSQYRYYYLEAVTRRKYG